MNLGLVLHRARDTEGALASSRRAIELEPDFAEAHYNLGNMLRGRKDLDAAIASFRRCIDLAPEHAEAHCNLGNALRQKGLYADAVLSLRRGHELGSKRGANWRYESERWLREAEELERRNK